MYIIILTFIGLIIYGFLKTRKKEGSQGEGIAPSDPPQDDNGEEKDK